MRHFSPTEIDAILNAKAPHPHVEDVPTDFFEHMEQRILATVAAEDKKAAAEAPHATPVIAIHQQKRHRNWRYAVAAAVVVLVCGLSIHYGHSLSTTIDNNSANIYAITTDMTDDDIEDLDELYEADVFLSEL